MGLRRIFGGEESAKFVAQEQATQTPEIKRGGIFYLKSPLTRASGSTVGKEGDQIIIQQVFEEGKFVQIGIVDTLTSAMIEITPEFLATLSIAPIVPLEIEEKGIPSEIETPQAPTTLIEKAPDTVKVASIPEVQPEEIVQSAAFYLKEPLIRAGGETVGNAGDKIVIDQVFGTDARVQIHIVGTQIPAIIEVTPGLLAALSVESVKVSEVKTTTETSLVSKSKESGDVAREDLKVGAAFIIKDSIPEEFDLDKFWGKEGDEIVIEYITKDAVTYRFTKIDIPDFDWVGIRVPFSRQDFDTHFLDRLQKKSSE